MVRLPAEACLFGGNEIRCWLMAASTAKKSRFPCLVSNSKLPSPDSHLRPASKEKVDCKKPTMDKMVARWLVLLPHSRRVLALIVSAWFPLGVFACGRWTLLP